MKHLTGTVHFVSIPMMADPTGRIGSLHFKKVMPERLGEVYVGATTVDIYDHAQLRRLNALNREPKVHRRVVSVEVVEDGESLRLVRLLGD